MLIVNKQLFKTFINSRKLNLLVNNGKDVVNEEENGANFKIETPEFTLKFINIFYFFRF